MNISYTHESIRLTGRWDTHDPHCATATATGSYIEFAFAGTMALARFDVMTNATPRLHLWVQLDGGAMIETPIDSYLRVVAPEDGVHVCRIIYKGGTEHDRRWFAPLTGKVSFIGVQVEAPATLPADERPIIEFVGDSITEGVLIDMDYPLPGDPISYIDQNNRVWQDDVCATYAWLTAEAMTMRPIMMGYGAVGATYHRQGRGFGKIRLFNLCPAIKRACKGELSKRAARKDLCSERLDSFRKRERGERRAVCKCGVTYLGNTVKNGQLLERGASRKEVCADGADG